ncbi:hypothetical protein GKE82_04605 [Conexibacter sp. W3-3-2]|uniref:Uncharacterized protein n=1 Tax=Paraconexibacter algicola TaxID=2133960 RepID=A0A2T4UDF7_9ACTN|nr:MULTISPECIES: hypothetical protein [Solirubrobacterales]MTD43601.1 hypothetical protein [Conexibacter sp. W3-3-2]PTL55534.1 hypothetical protein C7Y72_17970 [Paraconexibacter algicola]
MSPTAAAAAPTVRYLDDLNLAQCILGDDVVLDRKTLTLYDVNAETRELRMIGSYSTPGEALGALDVLG